MFLRAGQMADLDARRAEVLGRAARIIQRQICTYIARKQFAELKRSAMQLQSFVRGTVSSLFVEVVGRSISDDDFLFSSIYTVNACGFGGILLTSHLSIFLLKSRNLGP